MSYNLQTLAHRIASLLDETPTVSLRILAEKLGIERHTIERAIRSTSGVSFRAFRQARIIEKATTLLCESPVLSIKQIAYALGYRSPQAFAKACRNSLQCSPTKLRKMLPAKNTRKAPAPDKSGS